MSSGGFDFSIVAPLPRQTAWQVWRVLEPWAGIPTGCHTVQVGGARVILRIELLLQNQELLPILLPYGGKGIDIVLELGPGGLLACWVRQPGSKAFHQVVVRHPKMMQLVQFTRF